MCWGVLVKEVRKREWKGKDREVVKGWGETRAVKKDVQER